MFNQRVPAVPVAMSDNVNSLNINPSVDLLTDRRLINIVLLTEANTETAEPGLDNRLGRVPRRSEV